MQQKLCFLYVVQYAVRSIPCLVGRDHLVNFTLTASVPNRSTPPRPLHRRPGRTRLRYQQRRHEPVVLITSSAVIAPSTYAAESNHWRLETMMGPGCDRLGVRDLDFGPQLVHRHLLLFVAGRARGRAQHRHSSRTGGSALSALHSHDGLSTTKFYIRRL